MEDTYQDIISTYEYLIVKTGLDHHEFLNYFENCTGKAPTQLEISLIGIAFCNVKLREQNANQVPKNVDSITMRKTEPRPADQAAMSKQTIPKNMGAQWSSITPHQEIARAVRCTDHSELAQDEERSVRVRVEIREALERGWDGDELEDFKMEEVD